MAALWFALFPLWPASQDSDQELIRATDLARQERFSEALTALVRFKQSSPGDPRGYHQAGMVLAQSGRLQEAAAEFRQALLRDPEGDDYRWAMARVLDRLGQIPEALEVLAPLQDQILSEATVPPDLWLLSDLYYKSDDLEKALTTLEAYRRRNPGDVRADLRLGQIYLIQGQAAEATQAFSAALEKDPRLAPAHHALGLALWRENEMARALGALFEAVSLDPENSDYRIDLGKLLVDSGRAEEALPHLEAAANDSPTPPVAFFELSRAYRRAGDPEKAAGYLERFKDAERRQKELDERKRRTASAVRRGEESLQDGAVFQALQSFQKAVELDPSHWLAHSYLAKIYLSSNLLGQASRHLLAMREIDPRSAEGNFLLASLWYRRKDYAEARKVAEEARSARPDYAELRNLLGNIYLALGLAVEAVTEYETAAALEPEREEFRLNLEVARKKLSSRP